MDVVRVGHVRMRVPGRHMMMPVTVRALWHRLVVLRIHIIWLTG